MTVVTNDVIISYGVYPLVGGLLMYGVGFTVLKIAEKHFVNKFSGD